MEMYTSRYTQQNKYKYIYTTSYLHKINK